MNIISRWPFAPLIALLLLAAGALSAAGAGRGSGLFDSGGFQMEIKDAYAFRGAPSLGGGDKVLVAVVSNHGFVPDVLDEYWDRRNALEKYFKDENTGLVYLEFTLDGKYKGLSYYFGPGNGCGYCADPDVKSTVRFANGRLSGKLTMPKGKDSKRTFEITLDVPVSGDDHGAAQGKGGGEPGKAYLAYHKALGGKDSNAIQTQLSKDRRAVWKKAEDGGNGSDFLSFLREEHPQDVRVTEAYVKGGKALILLEGKGASGAVTGEALYTLEDGAWHFEEETFKAAP